MALRYAEHDAEHFAATLVDLGGFAPGDVVVLRGGDADAARAALIALNDRIRTAGAADSMLVVYYSGHADAEALHLGATSFALTQLEQLVRGSPAAFRLLVVDACRSGALTRVKGGRPANPFPIALGDTLAADGVVFWTASAASRGGAGVRRDQGLVLQPLPGQRPRRPGRRRQRRRGHDRRGLRVRPRGDAARVEPHARGHPAPDVSRRARRPRCDRADPPGRRRSAPRRDSRPCRPRHDRARRLGRWPGRRRGRHPRPDAPAQRPRRQVLHPRARRYPPARRHDRRRRRRRARRRGSRARARRLRRGRRERGARHAARATMRSRPARSSAPR